MRILWYLMGLVYFIRSKSSVLTRAVSCFILLIISINVSFAFESSKHRFTHFTLANGLSQGTVNAIHQDQLGFMWFGTQDGLNRYDGYDFVHVGRNQSPDAKFLEGQYVLSLAEDNDSNLWVGTRSNGLARFNLRTGRVKTFNNIKGNSQSLTANGITHLLFTSKGQLWVGTYWGLNLYRPEHDNFVTFLHDEGSSGSINHNSISALYEDSLGYIWVGTGKGIQRINPSSLAVEQIKMLPFAVGNQKKYFVVNEVAEDNNGDLWLASNKGIFKYIDSKSYFLQQKGILGEGYNELYIEDILFDKTNNLWVASYADGLFKYNVTNKSRYHYQYGLTKPYSINTDQLFSLYLCKDDLLWIGTKGRGINRLDLIANEFFNYQHNHEPQYRLSDDNVYAIARYENTLWVGTGKGLNQIDLTTREVVNFSEVKGFEATLGSDTIVSISIDNQGQLWIGSSNKGAYFLAPNLAQPHKGQFRYLEPKTKDMGIGGYRNYASVIDDQGVIWFGSLSRGITSFDPKTQKYKQYNQKDPNNHLFNPSSVYSLFKDSQGQIWTGALGRGINYFDKRRQMFVRYDNYQGKGLSSEVVMSIAEDSSGYFWLGTDNGLNRLNIKTGEVKIYQQEDGLANNVIYSIQLDNADTLWMSTNKGLIHFDWRNNNFSHYPKSKGLASQEFNMGAGFRDEQGWLYFGGTEGLTFFDPSTINLNDHLPTPKLTKAMVFNQPILANVEFNQQVMLQQQISFADHLSLSFADKLFSFQFSALNYRSSHDNRYQYRLRGFSDNWLKVNAFQRVATFTSIPYGDYVFELKAANNDGYWNPQVTSLNVNISPPWWLNWWALGFYITVLFLMSLAFVRRWHRKVVQKETELKSEKQFSLQLERQVEMRTAQLEEQSEQLIDKNNRLIEAVEQAKAATKAKTEFLANMSHEIRTPMNGVMGLTDLLKQTPLNGKQQEYIEKIDLSSRQLTVIINDILDLSKIESGNMVLELASFSLQSVIDYLYASLNETAKRKGIDFAIKVDSRVPLDVKGDLVRVNQILLNLCSNAIKFTESGHVHVQISVVRRANFHQGFDYEFRVIDTGIGISPIQQNQLFDAFTQADASTTRRFGGTGLGLSISKQLCQLMKGSLSCESELGKGSCFTARVRLHLNDKIIDDQAFKPPNDDHYHVLYIDNNPLAVQSIESHLATVNISLDCVDSLEKAVALLADLLEQKQTAESIHYDAVIVEWTVSTGSKRSVNELFNALLSNCAPNKIPQLIVLTSYALDFVKRQLETTQSVSVLAKPSTNQALYQAIAHLQPDVVSDAQPQGSLAGWNILVAEDNMINQLVISEQLKKEQATFTLVENGQLCVEAVQNHHEFDAILMDIQMPVLSGVEATKQIRASQSHYQQQIPIIALTADVYDGAVEVYLEAGMNAYLAKPVKIEQIVSTLKKYVNK